MSKNKTETTNRNTTDLRINLQGMYTCMVALGIMWVLDLEPVRSWPWWSYLVPIAAFTSLYLMALLSNATMGTALMKRLFRRG